MAIDSSIALGVKPLQLESPINQMAKMYEMQNMQQSNQLNQLKMSDLQRAATKEQNLNALVRGFTPDMSSDDQVNALARAGHFEAAKSVAESAAKINADKRLSRTAELDEITKVHGLVKTGATRVLADPRQATARGVLQQIARQTGADMTDEFAQLDAIGEDPAKITRWAASHALEADKLLPKTDHVDIGGSINYTATDPMTGIPKIVGTTEKTPVPGAGAPKPLTAQQDTKLQHDIGKDRKTALDAIASFGDVKKATQSVREIPKSTLENVAGWTGYLPSISDASQSADTALNNLKGKVTSLGKIAASAGGAIGTMAVQEWTIIRDMIAALDEKSMTPADIKNQMDLIDAHVAGAEERLREAYQTTHQEDFVRYPNRFELPSAGASAPPADKTTKAAPAAKRNAKDEADYQAWMKSQQKPKAIAR